MMSLAIQRFATGTTERTKRSTIIAAAYDGFVSQTRRISRGHDAQRDEPLAQGRTLGVWVARTAAHHDDWMGHALNKATPTNPSAPTVDDGRGLLVLRVP